MKTLGCTLLTLAAALAAAPATAQESPQVPREKENNATVYAGYRFGGSFTDITTGKTWDVTEGPAFSAAADFGIDRNTQWEVFVSHRNASLRASGFSPLTDDIRLGITYLHLGGTYFTEGVGRGPYAVGGLGVTNFSPGASGLSSETRFSLNVGFGYMVPLAQRFALKLEARGYATLIDSSSSLFCSGGCVVQIKGSTFTQAELMAGLAARF
jgi:outer membrane protein with beta-barrel domain